MTKHIQWLMIVALALVLITVCFAEVMRGEDPRSANKEALTADLSNLALRAQEYYRRPMSKGGGGGTFAGLTADAAGFSKLASKGSNGNGMFWIRTAGDATSVEVEGFGTQIGADGQPINVRITVMADSCAFMYCN